jgi:hypothetical protein
MRPGSPISSTCYVQHPPGMFLTLGWVPIKSYQRCPRPHHNPTRINRPPSPPSLPTHCTTSSCAAKQGLSGVAEPRPGPPSRKQTWRALHRRRHPPGFLELIVWPSHPPTPTPPKPISIPGAPTLPPAGGPAPQPERAEGPAAAGRALTFLPPLGHPEPPHGIQNWHWLSTPEALRDSRQVPAHPAPHATGARTRAGGAVAADAAAVTDGGAVGAGPRLRVRLGRGAGARPARRRPPKGRRRGPAGSGRGVGVGAGPGTSGGRRPWRLRGITPRDGPRAAGALRGAGRGVARVVLAGARRGKWARPPRRSRSLQNGASSAGRQMRAPPPISRAPPPARAATKQRACTLGPRTTRLYVDHEPLARSDPPPPPAPRLQRRLRPSRAPRAR